MAIDIYKLMSGIGVIIDDALNPKYQDTSDKIFNIIKQFEDKHIPYCKYYELPNDKALRNFTGVNFILLDWDLSGKNAEDTLSGFKLGDTLEKYQIDANIQFIKNLQEHYFVPVFIFTAFNTENIIERLKQENLYDKNKKNFIFVKSKSEVEKDGQLLSAIEKWLEYTPSIYVLKEWETTFSKAKNDLYWDFYKINDKWPNVLWEAYKEDNVSMSSELGKLITRNLMARMVHFDFEQKILEKDVNNISKDDIRNVMEGERFIKNKYLDKKRIYTGDIYKEEYQDSDGMKKRYFLNIRPQCDLILRTDNKMDSTKLYLIEGEIIDNPTSKSGLNKIFKEDGGNFKEDISNAIIFPVEGNIVKCSFKKMQVRAFRGFKTKRIGRLLPPYITRIQQKYAFFLQREGLPRTAVKAVFQKDNKSIAK